MRRLVPSAILLVFAVLGGPFSAGAQAGEQEGKIRVLLTYGGHGFEEDSFFAMFDSMPGVEYTKAEFPQDFGLLKPGLEKQYDVIVRYDMINGIPAEQREAFAALLQKGIGLVSLHHNLGAHNRWAEYPKIIGGRFFLSSSSSSPYGDFYATQTNNSEVVAAYISKISFMNLQLGAGATYSMKNAGIKLGIRYELNLNDSGLLGNFDDVTGFDDIPTSEEVYHVDDIVVMGLNHLRIYIGYTYTLKSKVF